jgi:hypothetical protein
MLAAIAIIAFVSLIASVLVIAASMLSSRLSTSEEQYLVEEITPEPNGSARNEAIPPSS